MRRLGVVALAVLASAADAQAFGSPNFSMAMQQAEYRAQQRERELGLALSYGKDADTLVDLLPEGGIAQLTDTELQQRVADRIVGEITALIDIGWEAYRYGDYHTANELSDRAKTYAARTGLPDAEVDGLRTMAHMHCERAMIAEGVQDLEYQLYTSALWEFEKAWDCATEVGLKPQASIPGLIVQAHEGLIQEALESEGYRDAYEKIRALDQYIAERNADQGELPLVIPYRVTRMRIECIVGMVGELAEQQSETEWETLNTKVLNALADVHLPEGDRRALIQYATGVKKPEFVKPTQVPQEDPELIGPFNCPAVEENYVELDGGFVVPLLK